MAIQTGSTYISDSMTDITEISKANLGVSSMPTAKKLTRATAMTTDNRKQQYRRFACRYCNFWQWVVVAIIWLIFCRARHHRKSRITCNYFRFGSHIDISGCRSLLYSLANIILHLYMVLYPSVVGNCTFHSLRDRVCQRAQLLPAFLQLMSKLRGLTHRCWLILHSTLPAARQQTTETLTLLLV